MPSHTYCPGKTVSAANSAELYNEPSTYIESSIARGDEAAIRSTEMISPTMVEESGSDSVASDVEQQPADNMSVDAVPVAAPMNLPPEAAINAIPDSMELQLEPEGVGYLVDTAGNNMSIERGDVGRSWSYRDYMLITGNYTSLNAAAYNRENFANAGYDILIFHRKGEFRSAIVGYDSQEGALIDIVKIRETIEISAEVQNINEWCPEQEEYPDFTNCKSAEE